MTPTPVGLVLSGRRVNTAQPKKKKRRRCPPRAAGRNAGSVKRSHSTVAGPWTTTDDSRTVPMQSLWRFLRFGSGARGKVPAAADRRRPMQTLAEISILVDW